MSYSGKVFSLNDLYKQGHWSIRSKLKNEFKEIFTDVMIKAKVKKMNNFYLILFFNTRHDTDNMVGMTKVFADTMKGVYVKDDTKDYYKGLCIFPDPTLKHGNIEIILVEEI